jgi:octaprenyl-diphosphate synthase
VPGRPRESVRIRRFAPRLTPPHAPDGWRAPVSLAPVRPIFPQTAAAAPVGAATGLSPAPVTIEFLKPVIDDAMANVDAALRRALDSDVVLIRQVSEYIIKGGGKRLRPALLLLAAGATGYRGSDHYTLAAVVEMIHTATLLHDDVVDESKLRRGHATANAEFGNAASVLVGDFLYSRAFQMMVGVDRMQVLRILADATNVIAEGEVLQLMNAGNPNLTEASYLEVIRRKTAKLFEAAARLGAVLGGVDAQREEAFARYGMHLGTAFQLVDDVLDYSGNTDAIGKNLGDDLAEGKMTLPLIHALATGTGADGDLIRHAIAGGGLTDFAPVVGALERTGSLAYARSRAIAEGRNAASCLDGLPDSAHRQSLLELTTFAVQRTY